MIKLDNHIVADATEHLREAVNRIESEETVDKSLCTNIINDLDALEEMRNDSVMEVSMNTDVDALLSGFYTQSIESKEALKKLLVTVDEGRVPDPSDLRRADDYIERLRYIYDAIEMYASRVLSEDELPVSGSPVSDYAFAISNSKAMVTRQKLESIRQVLADFVEVYSLIEIYANALEPFQKKARDLLKVIEKDGIDADRATEQSKYASTFMEALRYDDFSTPEGAGLLGKVLEQTDSTVSLGLASHCYLLENKNDSKDEEITDNNADTSPVEDDSKEDSKGSIEIAIDHDVTSEKNVDIKASTDNPEDDTVKKSEEERADFLKTEAKEEESEAEEGTQEPVSDIVAKILEMGFEGEDVLLNEEVEKEIGGGEEKKTTSTIFVNDLRKGNTKLAIKILEAICHNGMLTEPYLIQNTNASDEMANITLSYLVRKGYLRKYSISLGEIFCASPRLIKAISQKEASKFIGVTQNCLSTGEYIEKPTAEIVASGLARSKLYAILHKTNEPQNTAYSTYVSERTFASVIVFDNDSEKSTLVCGAFWPESKEWDEFFDAIEGQLDANPEVSDLFVAGIDKKTAQCLSQLITEKVQGKYAFNEIRGYSLWDDAEITLEVEKEDKSDISDEQLSLMDLIEDEVEIDPEIASSTDSDSDNKIAETKSEKKYVNDIEGDAVNSLLTDGMYYAALAYEKAEAEVDEKKKPAYMQLAYAFNDPAAFCTYSSDLWFGLIGSGSDVEDASMIASAMRLFFSDQVHFDHNLRSVYSAISEYDLLELMPPLKNLLYEMSEFKINYKAGLDRYADYRRKSQKELDKEIQETRRLATDFYNKTIVGNKKEKTNHRRFIETMKMVFSPSGGLGECMKFVVDGETESKSTIEEFLKQYFYSEDADVSEDTFNDDMLWSYITSYWDIAGERMATRKRDDLKGHLKTNMINSMTKAVQILARWCSLMTDVEKNDEDEGDIAYKKIRASLLEKTDESIELINTSILDNSFSHAEKAGLMIINNTLLEIKRRIEGTYTETSRRFFYKDFLLTDDVMLNENYLPDMDCFSDNLERITLQHRILQHTKKRKTGHLKLEGRLTEILDEQGDDYGAAKLIADYLEITNPSNSYDRLIAEIESGEAYARETADLRRTDFIGELELAQSYGQIDNSVENQKEIILKAVGDWYDWATETSNYGFFKKVIDEYLLDIRRNAKIREKDILAELDAYKKANIAGLTVEEKAKRITKIQSAIKDLNYTVAEDLLSRKDADEDAVYSLIEEDFLKDFLENYDDFYQPVSSKNASLASLVKNRTRNKEERGAKRLADSWLPGGSNIGKLRLENLLCTLGFDIEDIKEQKTIGRFEEYKVQTVGAFTRQRNSYTHPIASLGSGMSEEGLRVVCLNGSYDADGLIDHMKQIGNAKPTLILLDHALPLVERRKLARKTKNSLGDKLFVVLDRAVMMYLIRNYDETKINRMLVSLIVPFAYYQPYVWESANVMPPEIFMGRKFELEKIKSPNGVNIVYGGRQLGKSALLKKAKEDIDWDENGDRAIYIDIKGLNYSEVAKKISHELNDQFILDEDPDTEDWDVLTRAIKKRLQSDNKRIPYMLLLLDEADAFIDSCAKVNYRPFDALKELQNIGVGRFKFVIAGLRDIVRFKRDALKNNSVLTHLEPMTVTPFSFSEARELMEIPLHYLGLRFPKDKESLITLIMATTNYFPGLIQLYCAKLVDAMRNKDYAGYDVVDSPIYEVSEEHIKKVLADPDFMDQIREKFEITLKLDEDNYYYLIALTMAWLYHNEGLNASYTAGDIKRVGDDFGIKKLAESDIEKLENLMIELKELNVLRSADDRYFRFTRFTFFQMMGTSDEVDNKLQDYMEA